MSVVKNKIIEDTSSSGGGDTCVVCFKNFEIYSIGECDHPVCYECSTRMRVLCQQNECPICRHNLSKVIFTTERRTYRELETKGRTEYYNKKYKIAFANISIQKAFYSLLDHQCAMCNCRPFHSFEALKEHVRKEHEHFYCDICTANLKIFSFERKCYNRQDLGMHRRKGDPDNKSHRGHPLCQYCDCRFLDRDDLFRHLRREHYFCHFCDADGSNQFYADYESLRAHFRNDHFLCEEGDCAREQFTAVFRTEIDLKAHIANTHGKTLGKLQAKQARTLQLQITLGPRNRSNQQENEQSTQNSRSRLGNGDQSSYNRSKVNQQQNQPTIDAQNEQEFPSLDGATHKSTIPTLIQPNLSLLHRSGPAGLARTKENFPALCGKSDVSDDNVVGTTNNKNGNHLPASVVVKKSNSIQQKSQDSMVIHVAGRPKNLTNEPIPNKNDFPALPRKLKKQLNLLDEDLIPSTSNITNMNVVAAKHKLLMNDYVSEVNSNSHQKLQLVQTTNDKSKNIQNKTYSLAKSDFPALAPAATPTPTHQTKSINGVAMGNGKLKNGNLPSSSGGLKNFELKNCKTNSNTDLSNKKTNKKANKSNDKKLTENKKEITKNKKNENNNEFNIINNNNKKQNVIDENILISTNVIAKSPKSNLSKTKILKPPPGFQAVTLDSLGTSNDLTFTTSLGEIFKVLPSPNLYLPPPDSTKRNQDLIVNFCNILPSSEAFEEFRSISKNFRDGTYDTFEYVEYCKDVLKDHFDEIFPELLALLPDISKQQDLYLHYSQHIKKQMKPETEQKLEICGECKQVLKNVDVTAHKKSHDLNLNFPSLSK